MVDSKTVNLRGLLRREFDLSDEAAGALICHGQVAIDGRVIGMGEMIWDRRELTGRMLRAGRREAMMFSDGRPIDQKPIEEVGTAIDLSEPMPAGLAEQMGLFR